MNSLAPACALDPGPGGGTGGTEAGGSGGASGAAPSCEPSTEEFADAADSNCDGLADPSPCEEEPVNMAVTCGDLELHLAETLQCLEPNCKQALHLRLSNTGSDAVDGNISFELFTDEEGTDLLSSRSYPIELDAGAQSVPLFVGDLVAAPESHFLRLTVGPDCSSELLEIRSLIFECGFFP